jgi:hypothetical protein
MSSCNFVQCIIDQNRVRSISLCRSAPRDSIAIYFLFFCVLLYFLCILEVYTHFWNSKGKIKTKNRRTVLGRLRPHGHGGLA